MTFLLEEVKVMVCHQRDLEGSKEGGLLFLCLVGGAFEVRLKGWEQLMGKCRGKGQGLEGPLHWEWE